MYLHCNLATLLTLQLVYDALFILFHFLIGSNRWQNHIFSSCAFSHNSGPLSWQYLFDSIVTVVIWTFSHVSYVFSLKGFQTLFLSSSSAVVLGCSTRLLPGSWSDSPSGQITLVPLHPRISEPLHFFIFPVDLCTGPFCAPVVQCAWERAAMQDANISLPLVMKLCPLWQPKMLHQNSKNAADDFIKLSPAEQNRLQG